MIEFKIGDKVVIHRRGNIAHWNDIMLDHADGKTGVIIHIEPKNIYTTPYLVQTGHPDLKESYRFSNGWRYDISNLDHYNILPNKLFKM